MHQYIDVFMGVFVIALGFGLVRAAQVKTDLDKLIARQSREIDCLLDANGAMFLAFVEDAATMHKLRNENDAMWGYIRQDKPLPAELAARRMEEDLIAISDQPIPFLPSDELVKIWEQEDKDQPYLFDAPEFNVYEQEAEADAARATKLVESELGGKVLEFHQIPDCEQ